MRYATKSVTLDGKSYNPGDIIPEDMADRAGAEKWSRAEGEPVPTPEKPKTGVTSQSFSATAAVNAEDDEEDTEEEETTEEDTTVETPEDETETEDTEDEESEEETTESEETPKEEEAPKKGRGRGKKK